MLGARLVISPTVSLGLRLPHPNERQVLVRVLGAKVRDWAGDGGHLKFVDYSSSSFSQLSVLCLKYQLKYMNLGLLKGIRRLFMWREWGNKRAFCYSVSLCAAWKTSRYSMPWLCFSPSAAWQPQRRDVAPRLRDLYLWRLNRARGLRKTLCLQPCAYKRSSQSRDNNCTSHPNTHPNTLKRQLWLTQAWLTARSLSIFFTLTYVIKAHI